MTRFESLVTTYDYSNHDEMIRDYVAISCISAHLWKLLLQDPELILEDLKNIAKTMKVSEDQANCIESKKSLSLRHSVNEVLETHQCYRCEGGCHIASNQRCLAKKATSSACSESGHFVKACHSKISLSNSKKKHFLRRSK